MVDDALAFPGRIERDEWVSQAKGLVRQHPLTDPYNRPGSGGSSKAPAVKKAAAKKAPAKKAAAKKAPAKKAAAGHKDDLKVVNGIGPVLEKTLNGYGIQTWEQLSAFTKKDVDTVDDALAFPGRIERDEWIPQAKDLIKRFPLTSPYHRPTRKTFLNASSDDDPWS